MCATRGRFGLRHQLAPDAGFQNESTADIPNGSIAVDPGGQFVVYGYWALDAAGQPAAAYLDRWSLPGGRLNATVRIGAGPLVGLRLTDDGRRLVTVSAHTISVYDTVSLQRLRTVDLPPGAGTPSVAAISPDGRRVVLGGRGGTVWFEDMATGARRERAGTHRAAVVAAFFGPTGDAATTVGNDNTVIVWDARAATPAQQLSGPTGQVQSAAASPDGTTLYTSSLDGDVLAWDLTGTRQFGRRAALGPGLRCCTSLAPQVPPLATSPDGSAFAARLGASTVGVFSTRTLQRRATFRVSAADGITALAWSPTAPVLAVGGHAGFVQTWNVAGTPRPAEAMLGLHAVLGRPEAIQALAFSPDGSLLAASERNETHPTLDLPALPAEFLATWRTDTGALVGPPQELAVGTGTGRSDQLAFSPDGRLLAAGVPDGRVLILDTSSGATTQTLSPPSGATVGGLRAQRDARHGDGGGHGGPVEPGERPGDGARADRGLGADHEPGLRARRPAVRDRRLPGRVGEAVVHPHAPAGGPGPAHGRRDDRDRGVRRPGPRAARRPGHRQGVRLADVPV